MGGTLATATRYAGLERPRALHRTPVGSRPVSRRLRGAGRRLALRVFFSSSLARRAIAGLRGSAPTMAHLALYDETVLGPVQQDEALFLHGLLRVTRPRTVVEFGFLQGHSALNFLLALEDDARLYSFDIDPSAERAANERLGHDKRFRFLRKSQTDITRDDIDGHPIDFVFIDAAHDLELNQATFERLLPMLAPDALIGVHDTGTVPRELFPDWHWLLRTEQNWVDGEYEGQPGERAFMNWLLDNHSDFSQIHLGSRRTIRCGVSLVQRSSRLPRSTD
jgi:predicted O-methyltransferase YrrM